MKEPPQKKPSESDDEYQVRLLQEFIEQYGSETTQNRLGEIAILAQVSDMTDRLLTIVHQITREGKILSDPILRAHILSTMRKVSERAAKIEGLVPKPQDPRRDVTIPPRRKKY